MRELGVLVVVCLIVFCTTPVFAQDTTGRMLVRTGDSNGGAPLPGVSVTIASPSLIGGARTEVTDERGEALFLTLAPGTYEATAALHGFATQERTEVRVRLGSLTAPRALDQQHRQPLSARPRQRRVRRSGRRS